MSVTDEQLAAIDSKYGMRVGSAVKWNAKALATRKVDLPLLRRRRRDGVGVIEEFFWWENATPTARIGFANRPGNEPYDIATLDSLDLHCVEQKQ